MVHRGFQFIKEIIVVAEFHHPESLGRILHGNESRILQDPACQDIVWHLHPDDVRRALYIPVGKGQKYAEDSLLIADAFEDDVHAYGKGIAPTYISSSPQGSCFPSRNLIIVASSVVLQTTCVASLPSAT